MRAIQISRRGGVTSFLDRLRELLVGPPRQRRERGVGGDASWSGRRHTDATATRMPAVTPPAAPGTPFARALQEDSNLEQDWLWYSTQISDEAELRYCLERALYIDPHSLEARRELGRLARRRLAAPPARWLQRWMSRAATRA